MASNIFSGVAGLKQGLDASWLREEVILNNIANVDTPNFKRSIVRFEDTYKQALEKGDSPELSLKKTREGHREIGVGQKELKGTVVQDNGTTMRMDGNNVDIEVEETELARNTIYYETLQRSINSEYSLLRMAIREGR